MNTATAIDLAIPSHLEHARPSIESLAVAAREGSKEAILVLRGMGVAWEASKPARKVVPIRPTMLAARVESIRAVPVNRYLRALFYVIVTAMTVHYVASVADYSARTYHAIAAR